METKPEGIWREYGSGSGGALSGGIEEGMAAASRIRVRTGRGRGVAPPLLLLGGPVPPPLLWPDLARHVIAADLDVAHHLPRHVVGLHTILVAHRCHDLSLSRRAAEGVGEELVSAHRSGGVVRLTDPVAA